MPIKKLNTIITGYGHAGHDLHHPCIGKATAAGAVSGKIGIVEPRPLIRNAGSALVFRSFQEVSGFDPDQTIVHIATPPDEHVSVLYTAAERGFHMFIIEKPLGVTCAEVDRLVNAAASRRLKIVPNLPWPDTPLTAKLLEIIRSGNHGQLVRFEMIQHKPRLPRVCELDGRASAFEVEMPHQISLALQLSGREASVIGANCKPFLSQNGPIPLMGGASIALRHRNTISDLMSDLDSPVKERRVDLYFEDGWRVRGWYPIDGNDGAQRVLLFDEHGALRMQDKYWSDPMTDLFIQTYRHFQDAGPAPLATLSLAVESVRLACDAKAVCGIGPDSSLDLDMERTAKGRRDGKNGVIVHQEAAA